MFQNKADEGEERRTILRDPPLAAGTFLPRDSALFPKPTSALGALLDSAQVLVQFYSKHRIAEAFVRKPSPIPDLLTDMTPTAQSKWLMLTPGHDLVIWLMASVQLGKWGSTGEILSVKDLLKAQVVLQPTFSLSMVTDGNQKRLALEKWSGVTLESLVMYTGDGRRWSLALGKLKTVRAHGAPLFVGQFIGPVRPNSTKP